MALAEQAATGQRNQKMGFLLNCFHFTHRVAVRVEVTAGLTQTVTRVVLAAAHLSIKLVALAFLVLATLVEMVEQQRFQMIQTAVEVVQAQRVRMVKPLVLAVRVVLV